MPLKVEEVEETGEETDEVGESVAWIIAVGRMVNFGADVGVGDMILVSLCCVCCGGRCSGKDPTGLGCLMSGCWCG